MIIRLFLLLSTIYAFQEEEPGKKTYNMHKGVVFVHQGNFFMTTNYWILISDISFDRYDEQVHLLKRHIQLLITLIQRQLRNPEQENLFAPRWTLSANELTLLKDTLEEYQSEYTELKTLVTLNNSTRGKRGLIDAGGKVLKYLFGTATSEDITILNEKISQLSETNEEFIHLLRSQATLLNDTLRIAKTNRQHIYSLIRKQTLIEETLVQQQYHLAFESAVRAVEFSIREFRTTVLEIRNAIETLEQGRLSTYFLLKEVLLNTLKEIQLHLPEGYSFLEPPRLETMFKYYQWTSITALALPKLLRIFAKIPLITPTGYFDIYEIIRLPVYYPTIKSFVYYNNSYPIIALSRNRQSYILLTYFDLTKCQTTPIAICSPNVPIWQSPRQSCEYSLYLGNEQSINQLCPRRLIMSYSPIFRRIDNHGTWTYSIPTPMSLTIKCPSSSQKETPVIITKINNTGILKLPELCVGYLPGIILTAHFQRKTTIQLENVRHFIIPSIQNILNETELTLIQTHLKQHLNPTKPSGKSTDADILRADTSLNKMELDLEQLLSTNPNHIHPSTFPPSNTIIIVASVILSVGLGSLLFIIYKYRRTPRPRPRRLRPTIELVPREPTNGSSTPPPSGTRTPILM